MKRNEVEIKYTWNTRLIYADEAAFESDFEKAKSMIRDLSAMENNMLDSSARLLQTLHLLTQAELTIDKLYTYAHLNADTDTSDNHFQTLRGKCENLHYELGTATYYVAPKLICLDDQTLEKWYALEPELLAFKRCIDCERRYKPHVLDDAGEKLLSQVNSCLGSEYNVREVFSYADLKFGEICDCEGKRIALTDTNYIPFMLDKERRVRKDAFKTLYATYAQFSNTYAALLNAYVKEKTTLAKVRGFSDSLSASVFADEVDTDIYDNLIASVNANMQVIYDYYALKKKALGVAELHMYDIYAPLVGEIDEKYTYEQAVDIVLDALQILGKEYVGVLEDGIRAKRWIDVFPTENKTGGAYSSGGYGMEPYILLNFTETLGDVSTLAHESGHSMHTWYSCKSNAPQDASYTIFVAEVASTVNELLLAHKLLKESADTSRKKYILNQLMETYKGTLFRQTMFAEFEKHIHALCEQGEILTADVLNEAYYQINRKYFGDGVALDKEIQYEWERIPHFYYNFYVYKYATCISAASTIVKRIESEGESYVKKYIRFLSCGGSKPPLEALKEAQIDMTSPDVVQAAIDDFSAVIKEFKALL